MRKATARVEVRGARCDTQNAGCEPQAGSRRFCAVLFSALIPRSLFLCILTCCVLPLSSFSQTTATLKGDSSHFEIGDAFALKLVVATPSGNAVNFPKFEGDSFGKIEIISRSKIDTASISGKIILTQTLHISAYDSGEFSIAPFAVHFYNAAEKRDDSILTNELLLNVSTLNADTSKPFMPIKAPLKVPYVWREFLPWIIGGLIWLVLLLAALFFYDRYRKKQKAAPARHRPKDPAHIWAQRELRKLESEKIWQTDVKSYYSRLSDILRSYLEYRYDYYALESTTVEIQEEIARLDVSMDASSKLMETLRLADFVKFAKMNPAPDEHLKSMQNALAFVETTKPVQLETKEDQPKNTNKKKKRK